jgi:hypothetical protein
MTNIPITRSRSRICYECDRDLYSKGKPIFDDKFAKQDSKGNWHCSDCQLTNIRRAKLRIYGPNHEETRDFLQKEEREIRAWNQAALKLGVGHYRKNKYTGRTLF